MAGEVNLFLGEVAELRRRVAGTQFAGVVAEVKGDRVRAVWGYDADGRPVLSPWLETSDHRGGARERRFYQKGQNVTISTVDGQMDEAATISADAPNDTFKPPDQADDAGAESETYQLGKLQVTKKADSYEIFFNGQTRLLLKEDGNIEIKATEKVYIETPLVEMSKDLRVRGNVNVDGYVYAQGEVRAVNRVNLSTHTHGGVETGSGRTGPP